MGALSPTHWLIIAGVVVLLFGAKKMPDFARSMGQSMRILKAETSELRADSSTTPTDATGAPSGSAPASIAAPAQPAPAQPAPAQPAAANPTAAAPMQPAQTPAQPAGTPPTPS